MQVFSAEQIREAVHGISIKVNLDEELGNDFTMLTVLRGGFFFAHDLAMQLPHLIVMDFVQIETYGDHQRPGGPSRIVNPERLKSLQGKKVLIVDEICSSGSTLYELQAWLKAIGAAVVKTAVLISEPGVDRGSKEPTLDYIGLWYSEVGFLYGYGLDDQGRMRNIPEVFKL